MTCSVLSALAVTSQPVVAVDRIPAVAVPVIARRAIPTAVMAEHEWAGGSRHGNRNVVAFHQSSQPQIQGPEKCALCPHVSQP